MADRENSLAKRAGDHVTHARPSFAMSITEGRSRDDGATMTGFVAQNDKGLAQAFLLIPRGMPAYHASRKSYISINMLYAWGEHRIRKKSGAKAISSLAATAAPRASLEEFRLFLFGFDK